MWSILQIFLNLRCILPSILALGTNQHSASSRVPTPSLPERCIAEIDHTRACRLSAVYKGCMIHVMEYNLHADSKPSEAWHCGRNGGSRLPAVTAAPCAVALTAGTSQGMHTIDTGVYGDLQKKFTVTATTDCT